MAYQLNDQGQYLVPIVDFGNRLQDNFGLRVREHSAFGGVSPVHAPNSYHKYDEAIDITDWRDDTIDGVGWQTRTGNLQNLLAGAGPEVIGPNSGDPNHSTHLHLAAKDGLLTLNEDQYKYFFGGDAGGLRATFKPLDMGATTVVIDAPSGETPAPRVEAKERAQEYSKMSKAELDSAYDALRAGGDLAKAEDEGMKMHKAYFKKA